MGVAAIPAALAGGGSLLSFLGRPRVPEAGGLESRAFEEQIAASREQRGGLRGLRNIGLPALGQARDFFGNIVSGDIGAALAPEQNAIASSFRGALQNVNERGRGGVADLTRQNLRRDLVAEQARIVGPIRSNAAAQLANIGIPTATAGTGAVSGFGQVGGALQTGRIQQAGLQAVLGQQAGRSAGNFISDLVQNQGTKSTGPNATGGDVGSAIANMNSKSAGANAPATSGGFA